MVICFHPGCLGAKPDSLTQCWDVYPKEGDSTYGMVNPYNFWPVFTSEQLGVSIWASILAFLALHVAQVVDYSALLDDICKASPDDPHASANCSSPHWTSDDSGLLRLDGWLYVPDSGDLHLQVMHWKHNHPLSGHPGQSKTLKLIWHDFVWPNLWTDVINYVRSYTSCGHLKSAHHKPYGTLQQLPIPPWPWESISMDFIEWLPLSRQFTAILVVVDHLSKQAIFIPTADKVSSLELALLFIQHVFAKHRVPTHVTSDWSTEFVSWFFHSLGLALDMTLHFISSYHPEANGQTEHVNQTLEQYL